MRRSWTAAPRAFAAEMLKLRRTSAVLVAMLSPYVVVLIFFLFAYFEGSRIFGSGNISAWRWLCESIFVTWTAGFLPLVLGLVTALAAAIEHRSDGLRRLFVLPVGRGTLYLAKQAAIVVLLALSHLLLAAGVLLAGLVLRWTRSGMGFEDVVPLGLLAGLAMVTTLASFFALALQTWLALVRKDFAAPIALAVLAMVSLLSLKSVGGSLLPYHPWAYPGEAVRALISDAADPSWWLAGLVAGTIFAAVAGWGFGRRDVL